MLKRSIIAILLFVGFILTYHFKIFPLLLGVITLAGSYEMFNLAQRDKSKSPFQLLVYFTLFLTSMFLTYKLYVLNENLVYLIITFLVFNDSFAYLGGKLIGRHKFCRISPNKTIEGIISGVVVTIGLYYLLGYIYLHVDLGNLASFLPMLDPVILDQNSFKIYPLIIVLIICACGIISDLAESYIKRFYHVKDFSNILGEQGGVVDRVDSWVLTMIVLGIIFLA